MSKYDCLCAGLIVADHVCAPVERMPASGELVTTDRLELTIGGCASNVAVDLAKLGVNSGIAGRVGDDILGEFVLSVLKDAGVDTSQVSVSQTMQTSGTLIVNVMGEDRRFVHSVGANAEFTADQFDSESLQGCQVLYVGGYGLNPALSAERVSRLFKLARNANVTTLLDIVVADPDMVREMLTPVLPHTDIFLPNSDEARLVTGIDDATAQASHFRALGAQNVVVTCGANGVVAQLGDALVTLPGFPVEQIDGTGGGDAFAAGLIYGLLKQSDLAGCLRYGAAMGASCVQTSGATTGVFNAEELESFVATNA